MVQETGGCSGLAAGWKVQGGGVLEHIIMEDSSILEHGVDVKAGRRHPQTRRCWGRTAELEVEWRRPGRRRHGGRATVFRQPLFRPRSFFHGGRRLAPSHVDAGEPALPAPRSPPPSVSSRRPLFRPRRFDRIWHQSWRRSPRQQDGVDVGQVPARGEAVWQGLWRGRTWESDSADRARQFAFSVDCVWVGIFYARRTMADNTSLEQCEALDLGP
jgi:hypothetical protein